ncbi:MAG: CaiB/BaiF CoA-transferase family protein [Gammaproteobacteria bacterium]|nr:CaiB/BaiF CoA-transferase family protein [Gammaproteobacteria bacterium]MDD9958816.1 CaiB/BaiF CoA-transferase family protein [Gammaproteobacteria bacterium]
MDQQALPLSRYTVLDLSIARAGPTAVRLLADWGANVIRIEAPVEGDIAGSRHGPDSQNLHRNKRSLCLNLKSEKGKAVFMGLVKKADVVVENFRVDVKRRLGIDYESVKKINPSIIYGSISGFGQEGPYAERPAVDQVIQGMSGLMSITGEPDRGPMRAGIAVSDTSAGMFLSQGILLALLHREQTGEGQWVHTSLLEAMLCKLDFQAARYTMNKEVARQEGNNHPTLSPMGVFQTDDGLVNLAASTDKMWNAFCAETQAKQLANNADYKSVEGRLRNREAVWKEVNKITSQLSTAELVEKMNSVGIPCGPINTIGEAFGDEQVKFLNMTKTASHPSLGEFELLRSPINLSAFVQGGRFEKPGPELGEHSAEILREFGYSDQQIAELQDNGIIK